MDELSTAIIKEALHNPLLWQKLTDLLSETEEQMVLTLLQKKPRQMEAMAIETLQQKLTQNPAWVEILRAFLPPPLTSGATIGQAGIVGIVDLRQANFTGAHHVEIVASKVTISSMTSVPSPNLRQLLDQLEFKQIIILCYDYFLPVYRQYHQAKPALITALLAYVQAHEQQAKLQSVLASYDHTL